MPVSQTLPNRCPQASGQREITNKVCVWGLRWGEKSGTDHVRVYSMCACECRNWAHMPLCVNGCTHWHFVHAFVLWNPNEWLNSAATVVLLSTSSLFSCVNGGWSGSHVKDAYLSVLLGSDHWLCIKQGMCRVRPGLPPLPHSGVRCGCGGGVGRWVVIWSSLVEVHLLRF